MITSGSKKRFLILFRVGVYRCRMIKNALNVDINGEKIMLMCWRDIEHRMYMVTGGEVDHETVSLESNELSSPDAYQYHILFKINFI